MEILFEDSNLITFINSYTEENPILEIGEKCFFIFFNSIDYYAPLIGEGIIKYDRFNASINKHYFISLTKIHSNKFLVENYLLDKQFQVYFYNNSNPGVAAKSRNIIFTEKLDSEFFDENLIKAECFFVRKNIKEIFELQKYYLDIILNDTVNQVKNINLIKQNIV